MREHQNLKKKSKIFLGLLRYNKAKDVIDRPNNTYLKQTYSLQFVSFIKAYTKLLNIVYISKWLDTDIPNFVKSSNKLLYKLLYFYTNLVKINKNNTLNLVHTNSTNNFVMFFKPKKQLFLLFFKNKPNFVFTGGLMRKIMNEKRKSSKKLYKVAVSIIKLAIILIINKSYFSNCYLKLTNIGQLRSKILTTFTKYNLYKRVNYIIVSPRINLYAQKFSTRRAIKKYVKKRFKLNN